MDVMNRINLLRQDCSIATKTQVGDKALGLENEGNCLKTAQQSTKGLRQSGQLPMHRDFPIGWQWFGKLLIIFLTKKNRWNTLRTERKRIPVIESTIATIKEQQIRAKESGLVHLEKVCNVSLYLFLMERDFAVLKLDMVSTWEQWRLSFTARQMALLLYETCDDLSHMLGSDFRKSLSSLQTTTEEMQRFEKICKRLNQFKKVNHDFLYNEVRNLVSGHRSQDSLLFLKTIDSFNPMRVFKLGGDFYEVIDSLVEFLTQTIVRIGQPEIILKQMLASPKFLTSLERTSSPSRTD